VAGRRRGGSRRGWVGVLALGALASPGVPALEFSGGEGVSASLDTTVTYGISSRVSGRDERLVGVANGGRGWSTNIDDGNLNYDSGSLTGNRFSISSELEVNYRNFGLFARATGFYDFENAEGDRARTDLPGAADHLVGKRIRVLDAYGWLSSSEDAEHPWEIRVGNQVLSWGESTFIQNGINVINPVDVNALRAPGSRLRDALLPVPMVWGSISPTENTSLEGFYQLQWKEIEIDPAGSYFSGNDFASPGGDRVILGRGAYGDGALPDGGFKPVEDTFQAVPRAPDRRASDTGQWGLALRLFSEGLGGTEFGLYFLNTHSKLPLVNGITGSAQGALAAARIAGPPDDPSAGTGALVAGTTLAALARGLPPEQAIQAGIQAGVAAGQTPNQAQVIAAQAAEEGAVGPKTVGAITDAAVDAFARTARYRVVYPENIKTIGASFNTELGTTGWALQGELSYKLDVPMQVNTIELIGALLGAINARAAEANQLGNFLGQYGREIPGFITEDVLQFQVTATRLFGPVLGADALAVIGEVGVTWVPGLPDQDKGGPAGKGLRLNGPNTGLGGNPDLAPGANQPFAGQWLGPDHFVSEVSWGYQIRAQLEYNNALGPVTLRPRLAWRHDVDGISPGPGENFLEGRMAVSLGLSADYLSQWSADLSYTNFFGAGAFNLLNDRDYVAFSLAYSF